jgi:dihydroneopterin aldolase
MSQLNLDDELLERVADRVEESEFETIEEYVEFVLETVTADHLALGDIREVTRSDDDRDVEDHLKSLGYME